MRIGITLGDINGIGPEVALKTVHGEDCPKGTSIVFIGPISGLQPQCAALGLPVPDVIAYDSCLVQGAVAAWNTDADVSWQPGTLCADAAVAAVQAVRTGVRACLEGKLDALVTAPLNKQGLDLARIKFPGHTELLARECGVNRFGMLLMGKGLRVLLATRHLPLRRVPDALTEEVLRDALELGVDALPWLGCPQGRIGVCALNPHGGDGGVLGDEEQRVIIPVIEKARQLGFPVEGPVPADVIFHQALAGRYDIVIALYHDQGLGPLKMHAFDSGVNITLGLPIVRTSPDHGTAFDIAGRGCADPSSMTAALRMAFELAQRQNPWRSK